jgi:hypothetical protein
MPKQTKGDNISYSINEAEFKRVLKKIIQVPASVKKKKKLRKTNKKL